MGKGTATKRAEANALGRARNRSPEGRPKKKYERHIGGLEWLRSKSKITVAQERAGRRYGVAWRVANIEGSVSIRSCLNAARGEAPAEELRWANDRAAAVWVLEKRQELIRAQAILLGHEAGIAVLDLICGRQLTPREALTGASDRTIDDAVSGLRFALDILHRHWWAPAAELSR